MENLMEVSGHTGQLTITENKIIIQRKGIMGFIARGILNGDKEIPISSITAIQYRDANWLANGQIQFSVQGELGHKGGAFSAVNDENTILFTNKQKENFAKAKTLIDELMNKSKKNDSQVVQQLSVADELKKFSELREQGILTEEEFNIKKKELLG